MAEPTRDDIDALVGPATPHFAFQIRARVRELIADLPDRRSGPALRRGEDPPARRSRSRVVESRERRAGGASHQDRLGRDPVVRARRSAAASRAADGPVRPRHRRLARDRQGDRAPLRPRGSTKVAIGYMRSDAAAEETAAELRALGAEPVLVRGNVTSARVLEQVAELGPLDVFVHNAATGRDPPRARDRGQALGLDAERERPRVPRPDPRDRARDAERLLDRGDLEPRLDPGARELRARRHLEGRARVSRALSRGRARSGRNPGQRRLGRRRRHRGARPLPEPGGDARDGVAQRRRTHRHPGRHRRCRCVPQPRRTQRWCAARR